jgi:hypothetical protein
LVWVYVKILVGVFSCKILNILGFCGHLKNLMDSDSKFLEFFILLVSSLLGQHIFIILSIICHCYLHCSVLSFATRNCSCVGWRFFKSTATCLGLENPRHGMAEHLPLLTGDWTIRLFDNLLDSTFATCCCSNEGWRSPKRPPLVRAW